MGGVLMTFAAALIGSPALASVVLYYLRQRRRTKQALGAAPPLSPQEARKVKIKRVVASVLLVVSLSLFVYGGLGIWVNVVSNASATSSCSANTGASVSVEFPKDHEKVDRLTTMYGTACNLVKEQHAWPIVLAETSTVYYLLGGGELVISNAHTWSREITLGDTSQNVSGHPYRVSVILVNDATNATLNSINSRSRSEHIIPGIPLGAQIMFTITLIRN